jgi:hypothetical protein
VAELGGAHTDRLPQQLSSAAHETPPPQPLLTCLTVPTGYDKLRKHTLHMPQHRPLPAAIPYHMIAVDISSPLLLLSTAWDDLLHTVAVTEHGGMLMWQVCTTAAGTVTWPAYT